MRNIVRIDLTASEEKTFEDVDGRRIHAYSISSPSCMSLNGSGEQTNDHKWSFSI